MNYFFALPLGKLAQHIHKDLLQPLRTVDAEAQLRWTPPENLHITLAYLGSLTGIAAADSARGKAMQAARLESVLAVAEQIKRSSFKCDIQSLGFFPDAKSRILALHVEPCAALLALQGQLQNSLSEAGFVLGEGAYKPHITLARLKHRQHISGWQLPHYSASFQAKAFALYVSDQGQSKAKPKLYQKITEFSL